MRTGTLGVLILSSTGSLGQGPAAGSVAMAMPFSTAPRLAASREAGKAEESPGERAWKILHLGLKDRNADRRAKAVRALGLLTRNAEAEREAVLALKDEKPGVRLAAATALGSMHAENGKGNLEEALGDTEPSVVLAAANSLLLLHDEVGYDTYYEVLTGEKRASKGLVKEQLGTLKDRKKMAQMGFEEGIGFIPFAGIGYEVFKTVTKNDSSSLRAAAANKLAHDPEPDAGEALIEATADKDWKVRAAALDAVALRDDPALVSGITRALDDKNDVVRFTAAASVAHLSGLSRKDR